MVIAKVHARQAVIVHAKEVARQAVIVHAEVVVRQAVTLHVQAVVAVVVILHVQEDVMAIVEVPAVVPVEGTVQEVVDPVTQDATVLVRQAVIKDAQEVVKDHVRDNVTQSVADVQELAMVVQQILVVRAVKVDVRQLVIQVVQDHV